MLTWPPSSAELFSLPLDELAMSLLRYFDNGGDKVWSREKLTLESNAVQMGYHGDTYRARQQIGECFDWLTLHGLLAEQPGQDPYRPRNEGEWFYVTERGREAAAEVLGLTRVKASRLLDLNLHPLIARRVRSQFLLGEYEAAVLLAFREVEIRVRDLSQFDDSLIGVALMRQAFNPKNGALTNSELEGGEQVAIMELFAGAIGAFKNPSSHRQVDYGDFTVASEAVVLADLLLRLLDGYKPELT